LRAFRDVFHRPDPIADNTPKPVASSNFRLYKYAAAASPPFHFQPRGHAMPAEHELNQQYKAASAAGEAALSRFLSECFTETLLMREHVSSSALAAYFAGKLAQDGKAAQIQGVMVLEYLKSWVESEEAKIARARRLRFTEKREGSEIFDEARLALREKEAEHAREKLGAWKELEEMRHWPIRASRSRANADGLQV
jgi:hypothetical protein